MDFTLKLFRNESAINYNELNGLLRGMERDCYMNIVTR